MNFIILILAVFAGLSFAFMLLFYLRSERLIDKLNQKDDELLNLANSKDYFYSKRSIMRDDEKVLFLILQKLIPQDYSIFPQINLSHIIGVKNSFKDHDNLFWAIDHRSVDYVIFDKNFSPILAVELNGGSHFQYNRKNRDEAIKNILNKSGINLLTIQTTHRYDLTELQRLLNNNLNIL